MVPTGVNQVPKTSAPQKESHKRNKRRWEKVQTLISFKKVFNLCELFSISKQHRMPSQPLEAGNALFVAGAYCAAADVRASGFREGHFPHPTLNTVPSHYGDEGTRVPASDYGEFEVINGINSSRHPCKQLE